MNELLGNLLKQNGQLNTELYTKWVDANGFYLVIIISILIPIAVSAFYYLWLGNKTSKKYDSMGIWSAFGILSIIISLFTMFYVVGSQIAGSSSMQQILETQILKVAGIFQFFTVIFYYLSSFLFKKQSTYFEFTPHK